MFFHIRPIFIIITKCTQERGLICVLSADIGGLTQEKSHIPVLTAGNVFQINPIFIVIRDCTRERSPILVPSAGKVL
ncbi:unnamed protein product [Staurois parvus]|uniref:Uncharacterized protein n=1 Tax=Staurois parvus TaxID=386267 RepID=A0ABN9CZ18_9NEOB|nr:unnamed protein product [Staurois parvus]